MNDELSNRIMNRIDIGQITPIPRWHFFLLRGFFWFLAGLSVIAGSFAVGAILFLLADYQKHDLWSISNGIKEILFMVPYIWIVVISLFIFIALVSIKYTKQGYRYRLRTIILTSLILSTALGMVLYFIGVGEITHNFSSKINFYEYVTYDSKQALNRPSLGRLSGVVLEVQDKNNFLMMDFNGQVWQVRIASSTRDDVFIPKASSTIRMIGFIEIPSNVFIPNSIYEWEK